MTNKLKYFIGNWKMFGDFASFKIVYTINQFILRTKKLTQKYKVVLCVPNTLINSFKQKLKPKSLSLGAQNCHHHDGYGPFTGFVSAMMIKKSGADYLILGHSENRKEGETNKIIKKKIVFALNQKLTVVFCIGETLNEKKNGRTFSVLKKQITDSLDLKSNIKKIIFAYEPVWSIGTNKIPDIKSLENTVKFIKKTYLKIFKAKIAPKVLYGGSVNSKNIRLFAVISELDGFLIGGSSQSPKKFIDIIKNYYK